MQIYIPATYQAALMALKRGTDADIERTDAIHAQHRAIATRLYDGIMDGTISEAHQRYNGKYGLTVYHRSTRGDYVQASHFLLDRDGDWLALSHRDIHDPADIELCPATRLTVSAA